MTREAGWFKQDGPDGLSPVRDRTERMGAHALVAKRAIRGEGLTR
jgi:hypothetical protein